MTKTRHKTKLILLLIILFTTLLGIQGYRHLSHKKSFHIAVAAPMTGKSIKTGKEILQGIELYLDKINEAGGVNGKKIILDVFDDKADGDVAVKNAELIADKSMSLAVIGHLYSSNSIRAGKIYKEKQIPAITPCSTNVKVTKGNDWYFRMVFDDNLQGKFLANY